MNYSQAYQFQLDLLENKITPEDIISTFQRHSVDGLTADEFNGLWQASKSKQMPFDYLDLELDIVGTGGDGLDTINVSTLACLVCAYNGIKVVKHGNRSGSGKCGSADVLEKMGYSLNKSEQSLKNDLDNNNFAFLFAPRFNPNFALVKDIRRQYGKPTYFNLLGPLLNPANPKFQILGISKVVSDFLPNTFELLTAQIKAQNCQTWLVQSLTGMDEISLLEPSNVWTTESSTFTINPQDYEFFGELSELQVADVDEAVEIFGRILEGKGTQAQNQIIALNAGAGIQLTGRANSYSQAVNMAMTILESGQLASYFAGLK